MRVHFTGIKGVGMAALALAYQDAGWEVTGSDTKEFQITDPVLKKRGIKVVEKFTPRNIWVLKKMVWVPALTKLIYTGAHHGAQNVEVKWAASRGVPTLNYAQALGEFFADKKQIVVCGVGGKTTTTAMMATILYEQGADPSWIIGTSEIGSLPWAGRFGKGEWAVIEGDEYVADPGGDKTPKFMYLNPKIVVCTNIAYDHPDVYKSKEEVEAVYRKFFDRTVENGGKVILSEGGEGIEGLEGAEEINKGIYRNLREVKGEIKRILQVPGEYNLKNAVLAVAAAREAGISEEKAIEAVGKYTGAKRRFELIGEIGGIGGVSLYDDYAHHPTEIAALLAAAREKFPDRQIRFIFQPHTFSRTKALFRKFADSLKAADETIMYPIFASAREEQDETVSSQMLAEEIKRRGGKAAYVKSGEKLVEYLVRTKQPPEVIFTVGAGNLYEFHQKIIAAMSSSGSDKNK